MKAKNNRRIVLILIMFLGMVSLHAQEPVIVPVKDMFSISGVGVMVTGKIQSGILKPGMMLEVKGRDKSDTVTVSKIYIKQKEVASATNEEVSINVKGVVLADLKMGMVLATPGTLQAGRLASANISLLTKEEGVTTNVKHNASVQLVLYDNTEYTNLLLKDITELQPGSKANVQFKFITGIAAAPGATFTLKAYGKTIGSGRIDSIAN